MVQNFKAPIRTHLEALVSTRRVQLSTRVNQFRNLPLVLLCIVDSYNFVSIKPRSKVFISTFFTQAATIKLCIYSQICNLVNAYTILRIMQDTITYLKSYFTGRDTTYSSIMGYYYICVLIKSNSTVGVSDKNAPYVVSLIL